VLLQPDPVARAVDEGVSVSRLFDDGSSGPVHLLRRDSGPGGVEGCLLRPAYDVVDLLDLIRGRTDHHGPAEVGAVALDPATEVHDHRIPIPDSPVSRFVVGRGSVGTRSHDGEGHGVMALLLQVRGQQPGHVPLGAAFQALAGDPVERLVRPSSSALKQVNLGGILLRTERGEDWRGRAERSAGNSGLHFDQMRGPHSVGHGERTGGRELGPHHPVRVGPVRPALDVDGLTHRRGLSSEPFQFRDHQNGIASPAQDQCGQPLQRKGIVAGQIQEVRSGCHQ
jgi:hypothetical protein